MVMAEPYSDSSRLDISLEPSLHQGQSYFPGDHVRGHVALHYPDHVPGIEATINFAGSSTVPIQENGRLFSPVQIHESNHVSLSKSNLPRTKYDDRIIWPFSFQIPNNVHPSMSASLSRYSNDDSFAKHPGYTLPPTFRAPRKRTHSQSAQKKYEDRHVTIRYALIATITKSGQSKEIMTCTKDIQISPHPFIDSRVPTFHIDSSLHRISPSNLTTSVLDNDNVYNQYLFWKAMTPSIHLHLSMPGTVVAGQPLAINVSFDHSFVRCATEKLPPVILQSLEVHVDALTYARLPNISHRVSQRQWQERLLSCSLDAARVPIEERSCVLAESLSHNWNINSLVPELDNSTLDMPTFKTWNIALSYTLHVRGEVRLDDDKMQFNFKRPLVVLPASSAKESLPSNGSTPHQSMHFSREASAPPPYSKYQDSAMGFSSSATEAVLPSYQAVLNENR